MKRDWLWDRNITIAGAQKILKSPEDKRFILMASLLLERKSNPKEVFRYIDPLLFCKKWPEIKRKMRQDKWIQNRIIFWQAIYETLLERYKKRGIEFRIAKHIVRDVLCELLGKEIRRIRKEEGLSQEQLAKKTGFSQQLVSRIEKGRENISLLTLKKISRALARNIDIKLSRI